jgi:hypothetical protein
VLSILDRAYEIHAAALAGYGPVRDHRLAHPFGVPENMPTHEWHVSSDVMQSLYDAMPPPFPIPNPKNGDDGTPRLFGWLVIRDKSLPANSMTLREAA